MLESELTSQDKKAQVKLVTSASLITERVWDSFSLFLLFHDKKTTEMLNSNTGGGWIWTVTNYFHFFRSSTWELTLFNPLNNFQFRTTSICQVDNNGNLINSGQFVQARLSDHEEICVQDFSSFLKHDRQKDSLKLASHVFRPSYKNYECVTLFDNGVRNCHLFLG